MDRRNQNAKGGRRMLARSVALAVASAAGALVGTAHQASASVVDVVLSRTLAGDTAGNTGNNGINAVTYTPSLLNIPDAPQPNPPTVSYDAADMLDPGTLWNSLLCPATSVNNTTGSAITTIYQQNIPLVNSLGTSTADLLSVSFTENNNKNDTIHQTGMGNGTNPGTDGLAANPALPTQAGPPNGPANLTGLVGQSWFNNGAGSEIMNFGLTGLIPGHSYKLYVYGAGANNGNGGTYTVPAANQDIVNGYNTASGAYSTEPNKNGIYRSVFDATGINPAPELGLTWTVLPVVADGSGNLTFSVSTDVATGSKGYINGFQLDDLNVPEPASVGLLGVGSLALMLRKRKRQT
jgi:hypothetical protein